MVSKSLLCKVLLALVLYCGTSQLSTAQRTAPELPLTPRQPQVQLRLPVVVQAPANGATKLAAPPTTVRQVALARPQPLFLLNSEVIIAPDLAGLQPTEIKNVTVYKGQDAPAQWRDLVTFGIIDITSKQKIKFKSRTLAAIGKDLGLSGPMRYTINAMPVADASLRIALDAIGEIKITRATPEAPAATVAISIRLPKPGPPRQDPPGTIYIRGVAAY